MMLFIRSDERSEFNIHYSVIFGLLLIPKDYYMIVGEASIAIILTPLLIAFMIFLIFTEAVRAEKKVKRTSEVRIPASVNKGKNYKK